MKALVTGGAGFIGSNLVDALLARGDDVAIVDNLSTGKRENLDGALAAGARLLEADITDGVRMAELVGAEVPDAIFHLAAQIDVRRSVADPAFDASVNVIGTINMLEAARAAQVPRFVNTSTGGAIYGNAPSLPADERTPARPLAGYGQSKYAAEGFCGLYERLYGMATASLRYGNVFGPRQDPKGEAGVIAIFCGKLRAGEAPTIFGDGSQTRDYVYVADVVAANLAAAARPEATGPFNIGRGVEVSVLEIVESLKALAGASALAFEPVHEPERLGEVQRSVLDATRAREELGWDARVDLAEGLRRTLASQ